MMEIKKCKIKKCERPLPEGYNYKRCENCRNERVKTFKDTGKAALGLAVLVGGTALTVITNGKNKS